MIRRPFDGKGGRDRRVETDRPDSSTATPEGVDRHTLNAELGICALRSGQERLFQKSSLNIFFLYVFFL